MLSPGAILILVIAVFLGAPYTPLDSNTLFVTQKFGETSRVAKNLLLVTAHPDDEAMFFAPTLLALTRKPEVNVFHLCLSDGNADGLGSVRKAELGVSVELLGIPKQKSWVINHPQLKDNITAEWDSAVIARAVKPYVTELKIDTVLTFDTRGISGHPNHISILEGVKTLIQNINATTPNEPLPRLFSLFSAPLATKYISLTSVVMGKLDLYIYFALRKLEDLVIFVISYQDPTILAPLIPRHEEMGASPVFISGYEGYLTSLSAMTAHASQMVWFRWLYVGFSRYMWANAWDEVHF
ncbi:putative deacetylase LmbE-like domain-containing protein [Crepidotus variabilis]|uniref:N-acetylglucosaminylphosphatidylinositol deacetylase n=1 Tax=Crepidotus variabilis TaxID=179855 RepID=A0A9P6JL85_9AGAR|nr:putative deacetylase LmbE-like domain-containing protein [Crepidotus variabilis]